MKHFLRVASLSLLMFYSCEQKGYTNTKYYTRCVITHAKEQYKYGGLIPEKTYSYKTSCGYNLSSTTRVEVGDTITVEVINIKKKK